MDTKSIPQEILGRLQTVYALIYDRFSHSFGGMFIMSQWQWIRMGLVVVGYICIRPFLVKIGGWINEAEMRKKEKAENAKKDKERRAKRAEGKANIGANSLRGGRVIGEIVEENKEDMVVEDVDLGSSIKARNRKAKAGGGVKNMQPEVSDEMRRILEEMSSDDDVEDLLTA